MKKILYFAFTAIAIAFTTTSCSSDDNSMLKGPTTRPVEIITDPIKTQTEGDYSIKVFTNTKEFYAPSTAPIIIEITDNKDETNKVFTNTKMAITMHMTMQDGHQMSHSAPITQLRPVAGTTNKFEGEIMFSMAGMELDKNYWTITVESENKGNKIKTDINTTVRPGNFFDRENIINSIAKGDNKTLEMFTYNGKNHFIAFHQIPNPKVGRNKMQVSVFRSEKMGMEFPVVENLSIEIDPRMPDMANHGVSAAINPLKYNSNIGMYDGTIVFNMPGYWYINLVVKDEAGNIVAGKPVYTPVRVNKDTDITPVLGDKFLDIFI
ncbi:MULTISPECIES: hypothetical protein [unclassified Myroides]|uniref:hypothetical protein n=1 Tax=unclassified Myroides TaxID=2642485 RepID=UPI003100B42C